MRFSEIDIEGILAVMPFKGVVPSRASDRTYRNIQETWVVIGVDTTGVRTDNLTVVPEQILADTFNALGFVHLPNDGAWVNPRKVRAEPLSAEEREAEVVDQDGWQCRLMFNGVQHPGFGGESFVLLKTREGTVRAALTRSANAAVPFSRFATNDRR